MVTTFKLSLKNILHFQVIFFIACRKYDLQLGVQNANSCQLQFLVLNIQLHFSGGISEGNGMGRTLSLDTSTNGSTWNTTKYGNLTTSRSQHACIEFKKKIYVIGGKNESFNLHSVEMLSLTSGQWTEGPPVPSNVSGLQAVTYENVLYLIDPNGSVLRLDKDNNAWDKNLVVEPTTFTFLPAPVIKAEDCLQGTTKYLIFIFHEF